MAIRRVSLSRDDQQFLFELFLNLRNQRLSVWPGTLCHFQQLFTLLFDEEVDEGPNPLKSDLHIGGFITSVLVVRFQ